METVPVAARAPAAHPHDPNVRERLVEAAIGLFTKRGYAATSVREIVKGPAVFEARSSTTTSETRKASMSRSRGARTNGSRDAAGARDRERKRAEPGPEPRLGIWDVFSENTAAVRFLNAVF